MCIQFAFIFLETTIESTTSIPSSTEEATTASVENQVTIQSTGELTEL